MEKKKIVVIDDEQDLCLLIKTILEGTGLYEVSTAHDGEAGLALIKQVVPALIFVDFVMPKAGGDKVIAGIKADPAIAKTPIVLMSGLGEMIYSKAKDQWKWLPNNPATKNRGELPDVIADKTKANEAAEALGIKDYLQKPFKKETLVEIAKELLKVKEEVIKPEDY
ncbi:MAG: response regulator [Candidatus Omnitrophica bacterium]|nr:response regulator [Candidatus Omnitrophota bacterium]